MLNVIIAISPVTGLAALVLLAHPACRTRLPGWFRGDHGRTYRRSILIRLVPAILCGVLFVVGALGYLDQVTGASETGLSLHKPLKYFLLDLLIISTPLSALVAVAHLWHRTWTTRQPGWFRGEHGRRYRKRILRRLVPAVIAGGLSLLGALTYAAHLLGLLR